MRDCVYLIVLLQVREDLISAISYMYVTPNVRVLPAERSFLASWGSFHIVRAQVEGYEELCRMGVWDFVITISGSDLPVRNVDDIAMALAPYRGANLKTKEYRY